MTRKEKKSESLDVRLPHSVKQDFMQEAHARGETASEAVRRFIDTYLNETPAGQSSTPIGTFMTMAKPHLTKLAAMAGAITAGAFALTLMPTAVADEAVFERLDKNDDGAITPGEIAPGDDALFDLLDTDGSGTITPDEFEAEANVVKISDTVSTDGDTEQDVRIITVNATDVDMSEDGKIRIMRSVNERHVDIDMSDEDVEALIIDMRKQSEEHARIVD